ncbi:PQQ-binding-like beta-propeller repeat protein, partial [Planctomycetota bacterium]
MKKQTALAVLVLFLAAGILCGAPLTAEKLLKISKQQSGLFVHLDADKAELVSGIAQTGRFLAHGLCSNEAAAAAGRKQLTAAGLSGLTCMEALALEKLPYAKNTVDLLAAEDYSRLKARGVTPDEIVRVLTPRGMACLGITAADKGPLEQGLKRLGVTEYTFKNSYLTFIKPRPVGMDDWNHAKRGPQGNAVSRDMTLGVPNHLQWIAGPTRSYHRFSFGPLTSGPGRLLSAGGRNFYQQGKNIVARNAFNGVLLWIKPINTKFERMVASHTMFFTCPENRIIAWDAATGEKVREFQEDLRCFQLLLIDGTLLSAGGDGIKAFNPGTGKLKWAALPGVKGAVADQDRIYYASGPKVAAIGLKNGQPLWNQDISEYAGRKPALRFAFDGRLLFTHDADGGIEALALDGKDGRLLWKAKGPAKGMLFYADGLIWFEHASKEHAEGEPAITRDSEKLSKWVGHNAATGKVERTHAGPVTLQYACHTFYPSDRWMIANRPIYFMDWDTGKAYSFEGTRMQCGIAYFLGQGLFFGLYTTPSKCMCMPTSIAAITAFGSIGDIPNLGEVETQEEGRHVRGTASAPAGVFRYEWPMYRCDPARSSSVGTVLPNKLTEAWRRKLVKTAAPDTIIRHDWPMSRPVGDLITAPSVSNQRVFAGLFQDHRITALDIASGEVAWTFDTSSRVDAPPALYKGLCLFGDHNGWVYCVREDSGELVWRFRAAPADRRMVAYGQVESSWPVVGGVLIEKDTAYVMAGRTAEVDGGLYIHALQPATGELKWTARLNKRKIGQLGGYTPRYVKNEGFVGPSDVLVSDGTLLSMGGSSRGRVDLQTGAMVKKFHAAIPFGWNNSRFRADKYGTLSVPVTFIGKTAYTIWSGYTNSKRGNIEKRGKNKWAASVPDSKNVEALASISGQAAVKTSTRRPAVRLPLVSKAPVIDGKLDPAFSTQATALSFAFLDGTRKPPTETTTAWMLCDKENLYLAVHCRKKQRGIVCNKTERDDAVWQDEAIELYIDPQNKRGNRYFHIILNAAGVIQDAFDGKKAWDGSFKAAAVRQDGDWTAEIKLPFSELGVKPGDLKKVWSFNISRSARDPENKSWLEDTAWSPTGENSSHVPNMFGYAWLDAAAGGTDNKAFTAWYGKTAPKGSTAPAAAAAGPGKPAGLIMKNPAARIAAAAADVTIDGKIDDAYTKNGAALKFEYLDGSDGAPTEPTTAYILSDKNSLYLAFECTKKSMDNLVCKKTKRDDNVWMDEAVEIFIDPSNKRGNDYFHIIVNPAGVLQDSRKKDDASWNPDIKAACTKTDKAWIAELRIPFKDLGIEGAVPKVWSINLNRSARDSRYPQAVEDTAWSPTDTPSSHVPGMFGYVWLNAAAGGADDKAYEA